MPFPRKMEKTIYSEDEDGEFEDSFNDNTNNKPNLIINGNKAGKQTGKLQTQDDLDQTYSDDLRQSESITDSQDDETITNQTNKIPSNLGTINFTDGTQSNIGNN